MRLLSRLEARAALARGAWMKLNWNENIAHSCCIKCYDSAFCFLLCWLLYLLLATNYYDCGPSGGLRSPSTTPNHTAVQELQKIFSTSCCLKIIIISFNQIIWFIYLNKLCSICSVNFIINLICDVTNLSDSMIMWFPIWNKNGSNRKLSLTIRIVKK